jgi:surfeit locus 1 family protein
LDRLAQRRAFNAHVESVWAATPLDLSKDVPADLTDQEYRAVTATGTYDFENQVALRNQYWQNADGIEQYGYHLLTPLRLDNGGPTILVDRGWIPSEGNDTPSDWRKYDQPGAVSVSGVIRLGQTKAEMGGVPDPAIPADGHLDFWNVANLERVGDQLPYPILPAYIQLDPEPNRTEPPYPYQPEIELTEGPHQGYAYQWFTFATILLVGYPFFLRSQEKKFAIEAAEKADEEHK